MDSQKNKITFAIVAGTRPEIIKLAPVFFELQKSDWADVKFIATGQHSDLLAKALSDFGIKPDINLEVMSENQTLSGLTAKLIQKLDLLWKELSPQVVLVQGDTTSALAGALTAFYNKIEVGHIEAGLRTTNLMDPFPEELNRRLISKIANLHFAPTSAAFDSLKEENINPRSVINSGNTGIDSLFRMQDQITEGRINFNEKFADLLYEKQKKILVTTHRRESFGKPLENTCKAIAHLARRNESINFIFPVHPNPNVSTLVTSLLANIPNVKLIKPLMYSETVAMINQSLFILTDSGGIQEEAASIGKQVLVLRKETERFEAVNAGLAQLVGTDPEIIIPAAQKLIDEKPQDRGRQYLFGDGLASVRIAQELKVYTSKDE